MAVAFFHKVLSMTLPFIKFYPRDWQADNAVRSCSLEARGVWIEMLCIMAQCDPHGYLIGRDGKPMSDEVLSRLIGCDKGDLYRCMKELEDAKVFDRDPVSSAPYNRRMVRDQKKRDMGSRFGKAGGGNPRLKIREKDTRDQRPETRDHISIKDTYKGQDCSFSDTGELPIGEDAKAQEPTRKPPRRTKPYGEFGRVNLTEEERGKLIEAYGDDKFKKAVALLDNYIEAKGCRYKNHYAVMKRDGWVWREVMGGGTGKTSTHQPFETAEERRLKNCRAGTSMDPRDYL